MRQRTLPILMGVLLGAVVGAGLGAFQARGEGESPAPPPAATAGETPDTGSPGELRLRAGDTIAVAVFDHAELSSTLVVQPDGTVPFHFVGRIVAADRNPEDVERQIAAGLERVHNLREPLVSVALSRAADRTAYVLGRVRSSGSHLLPTSRPLTLLQLLALAGGFEDDADRGRVYLHRGLGASRTVRSIDLTGVERDGSSANDLMVEDGDTVYVPRTEEIAVLGEVNAPGSFTARSGKPWTVLGAIAQARGFTRYADKGEILWIREQGRGQKVQRLNADRILRGTDPDPQVAPGDLLFVTERAW